MSGAASADLNRRNINALVQELRLQRERADELEDKCKGLENTIRTLQAKILELEKKIIILSVSKGSGPTAR